MNENTNQIITEQQATAINSIKPNRFADEGFSLVADMTTAQLAYCSIKADTPEQKAKLYNAMNNPDERLADNINKVIAMRNLYIEVVNCTNEETGEVTACPRVVIIDEQGKSFQCVSIGVYSSLKKIVQIFGEPKTWEKPIKIEVNQVTKGTRKMLTLKVA